MIVALVWLMNNGRMEYSTHIYMSTIINTQILRSITRNEDIINKFELS